MNGQRVMTQSRCQQCGQLADHGNRALVIVAHGMTLNAEQPAST